ncbi:MAG: chromate resistance protein [Rhizobacter sp.]|nr:chromate resistance protein [Burkholderiales bacterium]
MDTASTQPLSTSSADLSRVIGTPNAPLFVDVRKTEDFVASDYFIPGAIRWNYDAGDAAPVEINDATSAVAYCVKGQHVGITGAEKLRSFSRDATFLEGGLRQWLTTDAPRVKKRADFGVTGESVSRWVTRAQPKIDRIACPWLVRRFIDPRAEFFYVPTSEVFAFAKANNAVAYDIPGAPIEHTGPLCSFDNFLRAFELTSPALERMASIVRGADTDALNLTPQSAGLLAISLGFSKNIAADHVMLNAMMPVYDALYRWVLDAVEFSDEKHNWKPA